MSPTHRNALLLRLAEHPLLEPLYTADKIWWMHAPDSCPEPVIILRLISYQHHTTHAGRTGLCDSRVQCDVYATTAAQAHELGHALVGQIGPPFSGTHHGADFTYSLLDEGLTEEREEGSGLYLARCDLMLGTREPAHP